MLNSCLNQLGMSSHFTFALDRDRKDFPPCLDQKNLSCHQMDPLRSRSTAGQTDLACTLPKWEPVDRKLSHVGESGFLTSFSAG